MKRRSLLKAALVALVLWQCPINVISAELSWRNWTSVEVNNAFASFAKNHRMPKDLHSWLSDKDIQMIDPYKVFDNVYFVGIRWVSSWLVKTSAGAVLIDTLHEPFVDRLLENIQTVGVNPEDIKWVLMTHGHFDHVGGYYRVAKIFKNARFVMSQRGWNEAFASAKQSRGTPGEWKMLEKVDQVIKDGETITCGDNTFLALETPGHTWGTVSYIYDAVWNNRKYRAVTVGGQGLNAIESNNQVKAYIASMNRLGDSQLNISVDLTAHPFTTGLTEQIPSIKTLKSGDEHPLINRQEYLDRLNRLQKNAENLLK